MDVVFEMEIMEQGLRRLERLVSVMAAPPGPAQLKAVFELLVVLVRARLSDRSLRALAYSNLHLLARKLVERAGKTGEHYIALTRRQYWQMLGSAAGGGLITLGTASLKVRIAGLHLAPFLEGLLAGTNYSLSFIVIQLCGFTLATKQPSMTAATLAESIREGAGGERLDTARDSGGAHRAFAALRGLRERRHGGARRDRHSICCIAGAPTTPS